MSRVQSPSPTPTPIKFPPKLPIRPLLRDKRLSLLRHSRLFVEPQLALHVRFFHRPHLLACCALAETEAVLTKHFTNFLLLRSNHNPVTYRRSSRIQPAWNNPLLTLVNPSRVNLCRLPSTYPA